MTKEETDEEELADLDDHPQQQASGARPAGPGEGRHVPVIGIMLVLFGAASFMLGSVTRSLVSRARRRPVVITERGADGIERLVHVGWIH